VLGADPEKRERAESPRQLEPEQTQLRPPEQALLVGAELPPGLCVVRLEDVAVARTEGREAAVGTAAPAARVRAVHEVGQSRRHRMPGQVDDPQAVWEALGQQWQRGEQRPARLDVRSPRRPQVLDSPAHLGHFEDARGVVIAAKVTAGLVARADRLVLDLEPWIQLAEVRRKPISSTASRAQERDDGRPGHRQSKYPPRCTEKLSLAWETGRARPMWLRRRRRGAAGPSGRRAARRSGGGRHGRA
jgi:hypothetical protein